MKELIENDLCFSFPDALEVKKFDGQQHGLGHAMKAVDFILEDSEMLYFLEVKDPEHPKSPKSNRNEFLEKMTSSALDEELKLKVRDSLVYEWASKNISPDKKRVFLVLIAIESLDTASLLQRVDSLKRIIPCGLPTVWKRELVSTCAVFNLSTWNETFSDRNWRVSRVSAS